MSRSAWRYALCAVVCFLGVGEDLAGQTGPSDRLVFSLRVEPSGTAAPGGAWTAEWVRVEEDRAQIAGGTVFRFGSAWGARAEGGLHRRFGPGIWLHGSVAAGAVSISNRIQALRVVTVGAAGLRTGPLVLAGRLQDVGVGPDDGTLAGGTVTWVLGTRLSLEGQAGVPIRGEVEGYSTLIGRLTSATASAYLGWQWPGAAAWQELAGTLDDPGTLSGALLLGVQVTRSRTYGLGLRMSRGDDGLRPALTLMTQVPLS